MIITFLYVYGLGSKDGDIALYIPDRLLVFIVEWIGNHSLVVGWCWRRKIIQGGHLHGMAGAGKV